jgi:hypothetical protein
MVDQVQPEGVGNAIEQALEVVQEYARPVVMDFKDPLTGTGAPALVTKDGIEAVPAHIFAEYLTRPRRRDGKAELTSLDSFIEHVNRFKSGESVVFACDSRTSPSLTALLDYHPAGAVSAPTSGTIAARSASRSPTSGRHGTSSTAWITAWG